MMILAIILTILSILIQGTMSNYIGYTYQSLSFFSTLYTLITLLIIYPHFENKKKHFIILVVSGIIIDFAYTDVFLLNTCLFIFCYYFSKAFHFFFPYNFLTINICNLLNVFLYHIVSFIFLTLSKYDNYTILVLLKILSHSIVMTFIYTSILYYMVIFIKKKLQLENVK